MKLALGTAQFGLDYGIANESGCVAVEEASKILGIAKSSGIDTLDTAISYGLSEKVLGQIGVDSWNVVTKLTAVPAGCVDVQEWVAEQIRQSMLRLQVSQLHAVLLHRPLQLLESVGVELYKALQKLKDQGLTRKIGVSIYEANELDMLFGVFPLDLVQAPVSILDRNIVVSGWASRLRDAGLEVHARSVFLQGLLLMPPALRPSKFERWDHVWERWDHWLAETGLTPLQGCLRYVNSLETLDRIIVGVNNAEHLNQITEAIHGEMPSLPDFNGFEFKELTNPNYWNGL